MSGPISSLPGVGMRAEAPERPAEVRPYPAVHEMPPPRTNTVLTGPEQSQLEHELVAARDQQKVMAAPPSEPAAPPAQAAKPAPAKPTPAKPAATAKKPAPRAASAPAPDVVPASSTRSIY